MQRLEAKESVSVSKVSPTLPPMAGCTYYQAMNHVFEECPVLLAHQMLPEHMNAAFAKPTNNLYSQTYNPGWRNHPNFSLAQNTNDHVRPNFSNNFQPFHYQQNFPNQVSPPSFKNQLSNMERKLDTFNKTQDTLIQAMLKIENNQVNQQANPISERQKETLSSQPLPNPRNFM